MKVLIINTVPTGMNGITNVIFNFLRAIDNIGIQFDLVSINHPEEYFSCELKKLNVSVHVIPRLNNILSYWFSLRKLIRQNQYDAVHIHGNSHTIVMELLAAKSADCKIRIVHAHTTKCLNIAVHKLLTPLFNILYTHGLSCGEAAGKFMFGHKNFSIVNNGIDTVKYAFNKECRDHIRVKYKWEGRKVIGHVGYFMAVKNHSWILEVFRELVLKDTSYHLVLIGDGELRGYIEDKARNYGLLDHITFMGSVHNVNEYLNAVDLIIMPSLFEGLPLSLIEQQANGLRCIVSDAITKEADKTGNITFLPLSSSSEEWANIIMNETIISDQTRQQFSDKAIQDIIRSGYSIKEEARKLKNIYIS